MLDQINASQVPDFIVFDEQPGVIGIHIMPHTTTHSVESWNLIIVYLILICIFGALLYGYDYSKRNAYIKILPQ